MSNGHTDDIETTLDLGHHRGKKRRLTWWALMALLAVILLGLAALWKNGSNEQNAQSYVTREATLGDLNVTVTATGTLQPVTQVDVGSELSGIIDTVEVDFNDQVKVGKVLARLDTTSLKAQVIKARAALNSAKAQQNESKATLKETEAELQKLMKSWELSGGKVPSKREIDAAEAARDRAHAAVVTSDAQIAEAQANLTVNETSLSKAVIRSPIDGVVLNRAVEPGQTVAASLQAPVLFTIAETLTQMELHVFVDEADVGQIENGQDATFTVDAYSDRSFKAKITEVRFTPTDTEGVVTYETVLSVDNSDLSLRPGMTATAVIATQHLENALLVPNAALRFTPPQTQGDSNNGGFISKLLPRRPHRPKQVREPGSRVWVLTSNKEQPIHPVTVKTGLTDGSLTAVLEGQLEPGQKVIVGREASKN